MKINDIKNHVTHFSLELKSKAVQEQEVIVGGKITSIVPPIDESYPFYIVMIDDVIGISYVHVPPDLMDESLDEFKIGNFVFVEGYVTLISRVDKKTQEIVKDASVVVYGMKHVSKDGE